MALRRNPTLPSDLQAAIDADLSIDALRGLMVLMTSVTETLDPRFLPHPSYRAVAALCHSPKRWAVVCNAHSPYVFVRAPVEFVDLSIWTIDLRAVLSEPEPRDLPPEVWEQVRAAAQRYIDAHPARGDEALLEMEPEGEA